MDHAIAIVSSSKRAQESAGFQQDCPLAGSTSDASVGNANECPTRQAAAIVALHPTLAGASNAGQRAVESSAVNVVPAYASPSRQQTVDAERPATTTASADDLATVPFRSTDHVAANLPPAQHCEPSPIPCALPAAGLPAVHATALQSCSTLSPTIHLSSTTPCATSCRQLYGESLSCVTASKTSIQSGMESISESISKSFIFFGKNLLTYLI